MTRSDKILLTLSATLILTFGVLIFILPQKDFSESENRYLSKMPSFSLSALLSGEYTKEISSFYTDQFPLRKFATSVYAISEGVLGKKASGNTIRYNEHLISISKKDVQKQDIPIPAVIIDSKHSLFKSQSNELLLYYKTDHHRTTYGAYLTYLKVCVLLDVEPYPEDYFKKEIAATDFYGTSFYSSRLPYFAVTPDTIELWRYNGDTDITLTVADKQDIKLGLYDFSRLDSADKYAVFLGGNYERASIYSSADKPTLLLFKDSFANAVIPFLALHFNIELIDPRYSTQAKLYQAYHSQEYDYRLFIGCLESF